MKKLWIGALMTLAATLGACNRSQAPGAANGNTPAPAPAATPAPTNTPAPAGQNSAVATPQAAPEAAGGRQDFVVVNQTGSTIMTLQVSPANETAWGPDILGQDVLANGQQAMVTFARSQAECIWDMRVTYDGGEEEAYPQLNLCEISAVTLTPETAIAR